MRRSFGGDTDRHLLQDDLNFFVTNLKCSPNVTYQTPCCTSKCCGKSCKRWSSGHRPWIEAILTNEWSLDCDPDPPSPSIFFGHKLYFFEIWKKMLEIEHWECSFMKSSKKFPRSTSSDGRWSQTFKLRNVEKVSLLFKFFNIISKIKRKRLLWLQQQLALQSPGVQLSQHNCFRHEVTASP